MQDFDRWKSSGGCGDLDWVLPDDAPLVFGLPEKALPDLIEVFSTISADPRLADLADLWHFGVFHAVEGTGGNPGSWPLPHEFLGDLAPLFPLAVLASGATHSLDAFRNRGVSVDIARRTLSYAGYFVRDYHKKHGVWGLAELAWLTNFVRARLFQLGRLSFMAAIYDWPFRAFRKRSTGEILTLCEPVTLELPDCDQVLAPGGRVVEVHIPADNGKLTPEECLKSYRQALDLFPQLYPGEKFAGFTCWSWLLDPGLSVILPSDSNIVRFQRAFHPLPVSGDHRQAYDLVFGDPDIDPLVAPKTTFLQHAIARYIASGNKMSSSAGFMTWDEVERMVQLNS